VQVNKNLLKSKDVFLGFSGGVDSIVCGCLLRKMGYNVILVHFNHKYLPEDDQISWKAQKFAANLNFSIVTIDNKKNINTHKGTEAGCREARITGFENLKTDIVLCHHLNDCVESYFLNFLRGNTEYNPIPAKTKMQNGCFLIRPFLLTTQKEVLNFAKRNNLLKWIAEDPLNKDLSKMRNWVRHVILPEIEKKYSGLEKVTRKKVMKHYASL